MLTSAYQTITLLLLAAAAPSSAGAPVKCIAFQPDEDTGLTGFGSFNTLPIGKRLNAGEAICSSTESWAFGIDPADQMIKLWEGNNVLFASSEWANAKALFIGGNTAEYGAHEYACNDEASPYLFVLYDGSRFKAFLDCSGSGGRTWRPKKCLR